MFFFVVVFSALKGIESINDAFFLPIISCIQSSKLPLQVHITHHLRTIPPSTNLTHLVNSIAFFFQMCVCMCVSVVISLILKKNSIFMFFFFYKNSHFFFFNFFFHLKLQKKTENLFLNC